MRLVKEQLPNIVIILGGPEVSYRAEEVLSNMELVNYVISGEGEEPFALLLNAIQKREEPKNISGVCYRKGEQLVISQPCTPVKNPPSPYTQAYLDALKGRIAYLETSRGCPYSCAFCLSGRCGNARFFDLERAKRELLLLANSGAQTVKLVDRTFNANRKRANELFCFIIEHYGKEIPKGVCFHFELAGDILDSQTISMLAAAPHGAMQFEIGLQSFNPKTLAAINRKTDVERLKNNISRLVSNANIHIHIDLIAGLPYEDFKSFRQSFNIAYALKPNMLQLGFLKLLYGAPMRENPEEFPCEYSKQSPYEVISTPWISSQELLNLHCIEDALERLFNSGRFPRTLRYLLEFGEQLPFDLFYQFGLFSAKNGTANISLDAYTALAFDYFKTQKGIDKEVLRDIMVCDWALQVILPEKLPPVLRICDSTLKKAVNLLELKEETRSQKGIKRGVALLYTENCAVYADYINKNPITGEYPLHKFKL